MLTRSRQFPGRRATKLDGKGVQLTKLLLGLRDRVVEQRMPRLRSPACLDHADELRGARALEPSRDPAAHEGAVARHGGSIHQVGRRPLAEPRLGQLAHVHLFYIRQRPPKETKSEITHASSTRGKRVVE